MCEASGGNQQRFFIFWRRNLSFSFQASIWFGLQLLPMAHYASPRLRFGGETCGGWASSSVIGWGGALGCGQLSWGGEWQEELIRLLAIRHVGKLVNVPESSMGHEPGRKAKRCKLWRKSAVLQ